MNRPPDAPDARPVEALATTSWWLPLLVGLAAGLVAWGAGELTLTSETGMGSSRGARAATNPIVYAIRNGIISFGILGGVLGLAQGLTGGLARRQVGSSVFGALVGLVLGATAGSGMARLLVPIYDRTVGLNNVIYPLAVHAGIYGAVGVRRSVWRSPWGEPARDQASSCGGCWEGWRAASPPWFFTTRSEFSCSRWTSPTARSP